jgi:C4-dicarboxylate-specific signal transduction histidine kinase
LSNNQGCPSAHRAPLPGAVTHAGLFRPQPCPLGELTASIAHEVSHLLAAVVSNAEACLRRLDRGTPNLDEARRSVEWIIKDGNRGGRCSGVSAPSRKKADTQTAPPDINDVVNEVIALVQRELFSNRVSPRMELAPATNHAPAFGARSQAACRH